MRKEKPRSKTANGERRTENGKRLVSEDGARVGRIVSEPELEAAIRAERADGRTIAFANGCFDILHVGHVRYLADAKAQADRLVVAINDDGSVSGLKGPGRPVLSDADRAEMVAALE